MGIPIDMIPAGWYLHPVTKEVFRIPGANLTLLAELQRAERRMYELESLLENKTEQLASANATIAKLNETVVRLKAEASSTRRLPSWRQLWQRRGGQAHGGEPEAEGATGGAQRHARQA